MPIKQFRLNRIVRSLKGVASRGRVSMKESDAHRMNCNPTMKEFEKLKQPVKLKNINQLVKGYIGVRFTDRLRDLEMRALQGKIAQDEYDIKLFRLALSVINDRVEKSK